MKTYHLAAASALVLATGVAPACKKAEAPVAPALAPAAVDATAAPAAEPAEPVAIPAAAAADAGVAAPEPAPENDGEERDPTATNTVVGVTLDEEAFEQAELPGEPRHIIAWTDRHGTNAVVIKRETPKGANSELVATHMIREGDASWTKVRDYKELVSNCIDHRLTLEAFAGAWSLTDLDKDGLGEATFAWSAGCRTDWSPVTHKVLVVESGEKFVLRGTTGGPFVADPATNETQQAFLEHARTVWAKTSVEAPPARAAYESEAEWNHNFLNWERLGPIPQGSSVKVIKATFGDPETTDAIEHDESASGLYFQTWSYPTQGVEMTIAGEDPKLADGALSSMRIKAPSKLATRLRISVGSSEADLKAAYDAFKNADASHGPWLGIGIEWTWLTFEVNDGKVVGIASGLGVQPPDKE